MPCIATIQHPLPDIHTRSCKVRFLVHIGDSVDRPAVNSHPHLNMLMILQGPANLESTSHRFFSAAKEKECHPVSSRNSNEAPTGFSHSKTFGAPHDLVQFLQ